MGFKLRHPLLAGVAGSAIIMTAVSAANQSGIYADYDYNYTKTPILSLAFRGLADGKYPWSVVDTDDEMDDMPSQSEGAYDDATIAVSESGDEIAVDNSEIAESDISANSVSGEDDVASVDNAEATDISANDVDESAQGENTDAEPVEEVHYEFQSVDPDYFSDAVFIGDSRTVGLSEYCEELDTRATFYSKISLTIYKVMEEAFVETEEGDKITIDEALQQNQFGKVYIMIGLNEIGTGNTEYFIKAYTDVINRIRELQPDAIIYIQSIMHVTEAKSSTDEYFNNANINERNEALSQLADNQTIFYLNMNESVDDENGNLIADLSFDDIHLKAASYDRWYTYLKDHAIVKE